MDSKKTCVPFRSLSQQEGVSNFEFCVVSMTRGNRFGHCIAATDSREYIYIYFYTLEIYHNI